MTKQKGLVIFANMAVLKLFFDAPEKFRSFYIHKLIVLNLHPDSSTTVLRISKLTWG
jgi:hypothetical protein